MTQEPQDTDLPQDPAEDQPIAEGDSQGAARIVPAWLLSFAMHATIGLVFSMVVFSQQTRDEELPPMKLAVLGPAPEKPKDEKPPERTFEKKPEIRIEVETEVPVPSNVVTVDVKIEPPVEVETPPSGRLEAVSTNEMGGTGGFMAIGVGGGARGMYGIRNGDEKRRALIRGHGSPGSENAVDAALRWFKKHQSANGMWDTANYYQNCTEEGKCEKGGSHDSSDANVSATGYALLCFLGAGYDHRSPNKYRPTIEAGIRWLREQQKSNGLLGNRNYEHAVATMALAEAYAMTQDGELRGAAQRAVDYLLSKQNKDVKGSGGLGWDYTEPTGRNDASVTGWCVMALKSAQGATLDVKNGMVGAKEWLRQSYELSNPNHAQIDPYTGVAEFVYSWKGASLQGEKDRVPMGALCAVFLGHHAGDKYLETMLNFVMKNQVPVSYPCNTYYMYYNTLSMFQAGGERWQKWNSTVRDMLVSSQRRDACFNGSWDWEGTAFHGNNIGRTLSTAYCCLSLEVYYRYKAIGNDKEAAGR